MTKSRFHLWYGLIAVWSLSACDDGVGPLRPDTTLRVIVRTTGVDPDVDGYSISVNSGNPYQLLPNSAIDIPVNPGMTRVVISGIEPNCTTSGETWYVRTLDIVARTITDLNFDIVCADVTADIEVSTLTTGFDQSDTGYSIVVDDGLVFPIGRENTTTVPGLKPGPHGVQLTNLPAHCVVDGGAKRPVTLGRNEMAKVLFRIECANPGSRRELAYYSTDGSQLSDLFTTRGTASTTRRVTSSGFDWSPDWSPDGTRLAFVSTRHGKSGIFTANADGTSPVQLTSGTSYTYPVWSPDGARIAFNSWSDHPLLWVMNADGSNVQHLARNAQFPAWSPDGGKILFTRWEECDYDFESCRSDLFVIDVKTGREQRITTDGGSADGAWSPSGQSIVLVRFGTLNIMPLDGGTGKLLLDPAALKRGSTIDSPSWSPDGQLIAFSSTHNTRSELFVITADGKQISRITAGVLNSHGPRWKPIAQ